MSKTERREAIAVVNILVRAHNKIARKGGWTKGNFKLPDSKCYCAIGAIRSAAGGIEAGNYVGMPFLNGRILPAYNRANALLTCGVEEAGDGLRDIAAFNDKSLTTKKDVLKAFKLAIATARKAVPSV